MDLFYLEEALEQTQHPQQGDQGQAHQVYTAEDPERHKPEQKNWRQSWNTRNNWFPRPTKGHNPRAFGLISGPCSTHSSRQEQLNHVREEASSPNPRKRARKATPFTTHDAPLLVSSDEEDEQDKTSPASPPDHEKGHSTIYE